MQLSICSFPNFFLAKVIVCAPETMYMIVIIFIFNNLFAIFKAMILRFSFFATINIKKNATALSRIPQGEVFRQD